MPEPARLLSIEAPNNLPVHSAARLSFEAWLALPEALRSRVPALSGLIVVAQDPTSGMLALVSGFASFCAARDADDEILGIALPLSEAEVRCAAGGEVTPFMVAMELGPQDAPSVRPQSDQPPSLLELALREERE